MNFVALVGVIHNIVARDKVTYLTIMVHGLNGNDFIDVLCFGNTADFVNKWFTKGKWITMQGRVSRNNYNGEWRTEIVASRVGFCGNKGNGGSDCKGKADYTVVADWEKVKNKGNKPTQEGFMDITDDLDQLPWEVN